MAILKSVESLTRYLGQLLFDFEYLSVQRFQKYASSGPENGLKEAVVPKKGSLGALGSTLGRAGIRKDLSFGLPAFCGCSGRRHSHENTMYLLF